MAARCRKFVPNLFNKTKCQSCFGAKETHSAEALESSKAARKISKCAYLFVSPDLDFSNPLHRTKRWQRRFFILYDDGELTYSVDDNPSTIPQGSVDMNKCTDVFDGDEKTGHEYSIGITVPNHPTLYVKGTSRDEIRRWFDVLVMYPRSLTIKTKRGPGGKLGSPINSPDEPSLYDEVEIDYSPTGGGAVSRHLSYYPAGAEKSISDDEDADSVHSKDSGDTYERSSRTRGRYKQRDMRRSKSEVRPSDLRLAEDEFNKKVPGQLSLAPSSDNQTKFSKERNIDGLPTRRAGEPETFSSVRSMKHRKAAKNQAVLQQSTDAVKPTPQSAPAVSATASTSGGVDVVDCATAASPALGRRLSIPNMSAVLKTPEHKSLTRTTSAVTATGGASGGAFTAFVYPPQTPSTATGVLLDANETDERKIAKNEHAKKSLEKSPIVRKGWLLVRQDSQSNVWSKHWFVLCGTSLSYYKDAKAEETNQIDGVIDVKSAYEVSTIKAERNHGFRIQTKEGEYILSAMTSGIRRNWIEAVESIIGEIRRAREKSARQDMGFVFESPLRSPRTLSTTATTPAAIAPPQSLAPVVPDPTSRVNSTLREMAERRRETGDDRPLEELYDVVAPSTDRKDSACSDTEREVSVLTSKQEVTNNPEILLQKPVIEVPQPPKSPSAFVSPSQRIKEKSRAKTPPRSRSPPPPSPLPITSHHAVSSKTPTPIDRMLLLPTGSSSDENDESLTAKLLESQKQVQHLQQQVQDVNSMVRKQRVEIESLQTKLDLTTSQLRDMETALTHSAQNLNKERKNSNRLNEAIEGLKRDHVQNNEYQAKCSHLERQLQDATHKLASQEVKMAMVSSLEDQLQIRTSKLATLEKVLGNTRRHLQDAVENVRETELHYQTKIEELEHDYEEERVQLQEKLHQMEDKLHKLVTESNNSVNSDLSGQLMKERAQSMRRLEELVKEQKGKIDQLTEENASARQQMEELQCFKDSAAVNQNQLENVQHKYNVLHTSIQTLESSLMDIKAELEIKDRELITKCQENASLLATIDELQDKCRLVQDSQMSSNDIAETYESERELLREELESVTLELNGALETSRNEIESLRRSHSEIVEELRESNAKVQSLKSRCSTLEMDLKKERSKAAVAVPSPPPAAPLNPSAAPSSDPGGYALSQVISLIAAVARCCERMTESAVAMLAGEMIETDIKVSINFSQEQRTALGNKTVEQLLKKFAGVRQRLNYIVKNSVTKKLYDELQGEKDALAEQLVNSGPGVGVGAAPNSVAGNESPPSGSTSEYLTALLERCRADILCISTDITRLDISHIEAKLQSLSTSLQNLDYQQKSTEHFSSDLALTSYCNKLAVQAAAMFEMARTLSSGVDLSKVLVSVENCLKSTSGIVTSIEDLSLRNYALLISERLLISYELDHLLLAGQWKGCDNQQEPSEDFTTKSLVAETLQRIDMFSLSQGKPLGGACLNVCLSTILQQNIAGRPSVELLRNETSLIAKLVQTLDTSLTSCIKEYCFQYTTDLVNFGTLEIGEVETLLANITKSLCRQTKLLVSKGNLSDLSVSWLYQQVCLACKKVEGLEPKDLVEIALKLSMLESKFNVSSSLITKRETSTLSQSLVSEARKLAGLSSELAKKSSTPGSMEGRIAALAQRLEQTDRSLSAYSGHYGDTVQQVMREVVNSLQMSVLRYQLGSGEHPASSKEQSLTQQIEQLKVQLQTARQRNTKLVNADQHERTVEELHDQMSSLKVEHSTELDESKRDMKMVLKSVKAEEYRLATELTEQIAELKDCLAEEKRSHQIELLRMAESKPDMVSGEEHAQLKDKVRDLENCLHEMQEEFEEELYQERRNHLAELEKTRAELLEVVTKASSQQLSTHELHQQYQIVIDKLKAEQASLQQWIDDIREAHRDEMDALQHERDAALADEVMATQAALEAMQSSHAIELEQERCKLKDLQEKASCLAQVERDLLLQTSENENKEKRIASLEAKVSSSTRKLAKLELNSARNADVISEMKSVNEKLTDRNSQLVEKFSHELSKINLTGKPSSDGQNMALKAQVESMAERLRLEQLGRRQLEDRLESMKAAYEQQLKQRDEEVKLEVAAAASPAVSSQSPPEDVLLKRRLRARSPSPHARRSSPPVFALSSSPRSGSGTSSVTESSADPKATISPRRLADRSYDLSRSKSAPSMEKQLTYSPSKRLCGTEELQSRHLPVLDTNDRGFVQYQKSGGISLADRMRKFT